MESNLNHIQARKANPVVMLIPDTKASNALFHQLLHMITL